MKKRTENLKMTLALNPKIDMLMRQEALKARLSLGEMLTKYREGYLEKLEDEKLDKRIQKELDEKGRVQCPKCSQMIIND